MQYSILYICRSNILKQIFPQGTTEVKHTTLMQNLIKHNLSELVKRYRYFLRIETDNCSISMHDILILEVHVMHEESYAIF